MRERRFLNCCSTSTREGKEAHCAGLYNQFYIVSLTFPGRLRLVRFPNPLHEVTFKSVGESDLA